MTTPFLHETIYRGQAAITALAQTRITICGAGSLGSHLAETLARQGASALTVIDMDRVEAHNIGTQVYDEGDIGAYKVEALRARCFHATGVEITALATRLAEENAVRLLRKADLVLDTFDNSASRQLVTGYCAARDIPCLHLGMNADYGEARWNEGYRVPQDVAAPDVCDYPLARNLILLLVAIGAECVLRWLADGRRESYTVTLRDFSIQPTE